jgi:hypothetical protein
MAQVPEAAVLLENLELNDLSTVVTEQHITWMKLWLNVFIHSILSSKSMKSLSEPLRPDQLWMGQGAGELYPEFETAEAPRQNQQAKWQPRSEWGATAVERQLAEDTERSCEVDRRGCGTAEQLWRGDADSGSRTLTLTSEGPDDLLPWVRCQVEGAHSHVIERVRCVSLTTLKWAAAVLRDNFFCKKIST